MRPITQTLCCTPPPPPWGMRWGADARCACTLTVPLLDAMLQGGAGINAANRVGPTPWAVTYAPPVSRPPRAAVRRTASAERAGGHRGDAAGTDRGARHQGDARRQRGRSRTRALPAKLQVSREFVVWNWQRVRAYSEDAGRLREACSSWSSVAPPTYRELHLPGREHAPDFVQRRGWLSEPKRRALAPRAFSPILMWSASESEDEDAGVIPTASMVSRSGRPCSGRGLDGVPRGRPVVAPRLGGRPRALPPLARHLGAAHPP